MGHDGQSLHEPSTGMDRNQKQDPPSELETCTPARWGQKQMMASVAMTRRALSTLEGVNPCG